jgi:hypothetical protein
VAGLPGVFAKNVAYLQGKPLGFDVPERVLNNFLGLNWQHHIILRERLFTPSLWKSRGTSCILILVQYF